MNQEEKYFLVVIDTQGDTAELSIQIAVNDQTYNFSTTITSSNPFPTAAIDFSANKILLFFPNQIGDDKYSFTTHLMNFDPDTSSVTDFDASGTVTISPMSLKTSSTSQDNEVVSVEHATQQDPFTFEVIGQDEIPHVFVHAQSGN